MVTSHSDRAKSLSGPHKTARSFTKFPDWVFDARRLSPATKLVYAALLSHTREGQIQAWPSVKRLAAMTGAGTTAVRRSLRHLEDLGMITTEIRPPHANRYTIVELSGADIESICASGGNSLTCGDASLRGSGLDSTPAVAYPTGAVAYPTGAAAYPTGAVNEEDQGKKNQGSRTNKQINRAAPKGADRPAESTQVPGTTARDSGQNTASPHLAARSAPGRPQAPKTVPPDVSLANNNGSLGGFRLGFDRIAGAGKPKKRQGVLGGSGSTEPVQAHQNGEVVAQ